MRGIGLEVCNKHHQEEYNARIIYTLVTLATRDNKIIENVAANININTASDFSQFLRENGNSRKQVNLLIYIDNEKLTANYLPERDDFDLSYDASQACSLRQGNGSPRYEKMVHTLAINGTEYLCESRVVNLKMSLKEKLKSANWNSFFFTDSDQRLVDMLSKTDIFFFPMRKGHYSQHRKRAKESANVLMSLNGGFLGAVLEKVLKYYITKSEDKSLFSLPRKVLLPGFIFQRSTGSHETTVVSRNDEMEIPLNRIYSYREWPISSNVSAITLSGAGFYCHDAASETVKCFSCDLTFQVPSLKGMHPQAYHIRRSPDCVFAQQNAPVHSGSNLSGTNEQEASNNGPPSPRAECKPSEIASNKNETPLDLHRNCNVESQTKYQSLLTMDASLSSTNETTANRNDEVENKSDASETTASLNRIQRDLSVSNSGSRKDCFADSILYPKAIANNNSTSDSVLTNSISNSHETSVACNSISPDMEAKPNNSVGASATNSDISRDATTAKSTSNVRDVMLTYKNNDLQGNSRADVRNQIERDSGNIPREATATLNDRSNDNLVASTDIQTLSYPPRNPEFANTSKRRSSFMYWKPEEKPNIEDLTEAGFYFTGVTDTVRCFHCDIGLADWNPQDDPWVEHARHSPECPHLSSNRDRTFIENVQTAWANVYTPKHSQFVEYTDRLKTFNKSSWPRDYVAQTPEMIATAGFFYTGNGDTVRCHYCDGGLREWEPNDDPWTEHARWFPFCKFVIRAKGMEFIRNAASGNGEEAAASREPELPAAFNSSSNIPLSISYEDQCKRKEQRNPMYSAAAESVMFSMGYSKTKVKKAINIYIGRTGRRDFKGVDLIEIILDKEDEGYSLSSDDDDNGIAPNNEPASAFGCTGGEEEEFDFSPEAVVKENERLLELKICTVCKERERSMIFVPCGHRLVCDQCSDEQYVCTHCNTIITQRIKTYFA